jgi:Tol biopolymer transport system component
LVDGWKVDLFCFQPVWGNPAVADLEGFRSRRRSGADYPAGRLLSLPSRDGKTIYFAKSDSGASPLWKVPVEGGEESHILDSVSAFSSGFAVARGGIYYFSGPRLRYLDFARGTSKSILTMEKPTGLGLAVSPDEHWLLYTQIDLGGSDLMLVENFR